MNLGSLSVQQQTFTLLGGLGVTLIVASLVAFALKRRMAPDRPHSVIDNLIARIKAWWVMVAVLGVAFIAGPEGVTVVFLLVSFAALREFMSLVYRDSGDYKIVAVSFFVVLPAQYLWVYLGWYATFTIFIPVYAFVALPVILAAGGDRSHLLERAARMQWALMICVFSISYLPALLTLDIPGYEGRELMLIAFLLLVVQSSDVLQYIWGKLLGKHAIAPVISPSKTWEGLIGGIASATALGAALYWITPFSPWHAAGMALVINVMGYLGGLVLSAIKRDRGAKDWGQLIEGHGGMLDRIDSLVFAAPVFFHLTRFGWT